MSRRCVRDHVGRGPGFVIAALSVALLAGCQAATLSPGPASPAPATPTGTRPPAATGPTTPPAGPTTPPAPAPTELPVAEGWNPAGALPGPRDSFEVVLLGDGRALAVGAHEWTLADETQVEPVADLWDPVTGAWTPTAPLNKIRREFGIAALTDGRALVAGGTNEGGQSFSSAYLFDPATETWTKTLGAMSVGRTSPVVAALPDGDALVAGGYFQLSPDLGRTPGSGVTLARVFADVEPEFQGAALATAEVLNPDGEWESTGPMRYARFGAQAVTLADGRVLVCGSEDTHRGVTVNADAAYSSEVYDPATRRFSDLARLPAIDRAALERGGGRGAVDVPDERPDFTTTGTLVALEDGGAVLIGWTGSWKHVGDITRSFRYDAAASRWTEIGTMYAFISDMAEDGREPLLTPGVPDLAGAVAARLPDGRVLVAGGLGPNRYPESGYNEHYTTDAATAWDPRTDAWVDLPPMPVAREGGRAVVLADGSVLVAGGTRSWREPPVDAEDDEFHSESVLDAVRFVPPR